MRKLNFIIGLFLLITSCKQGLEKDWSNFHNHTDSSVVTKFDTDIDPSLLPQCEKYFLDTMKGHGFPVDNVNFTRAVFFGSEALQSWFTKYKVFKNADRIELHLGCYTDEFLSVYVSDIDERRKRKGRVTLFLVPTKSGSQAQYNNKPIPDFNLGGLYP